MRAIDYFLNHLVVDGNCSKAARLLGKSQQDIWRWSKKKHLDMPIQLLPKAAEVLNMKPSEFIAQVFE